MLLLKNRYLAISCLVAIGFMALSIYLPPTFSNAVIIAGAAGAVLSIAVAVAIYVRGLMRQQRFKDMCVYLAVSLLLISVLVSCGYGFFQKDLKAAREYDQCTVTVKGVAERIRYDHSYLSSLEARITEINGESVDLRAIIEFESSSALSENDVFSLTGVSSLLEDNESYLVSDGFVMKVVADGYSVKKTDEADAPWYSVFWRISEQLQRTLEIHTEPETADLVGAMLIGNREELGSETTRDFRRIGISHMLALSGLHVSIVMGFLDFLLSRAEMRRSLRCVFLMMAAFLYLGVTGFSLSAARAVIMVCSVYLAYILSEDSDSITALFVSAVVIFALSPSAIFDVGYWMSFLATLGIIIISDVLSPLHYRLKKKPFYVQIAVKLLSAVSVTLAATVAVSGFSWLVFGEISLISVISNLIFSVPATLLLMLGMLLILFSWLPLVSELLALLLDLLAELFFDIASRLSDIRGIVVSMNYGFVRYIIPPMLALTLILVLVKLGKRWKWTVALPAAAAVIAFSICLNVHISDNRGVSDVVYVKNGRSEMMTVVNTDGASVCDVSSGGYTHLRDACKEASDLCATEIENLILTHYHQYHPNAVMRICEAYMVRNLYLPSPESDNDKRWHRAIVSRLEDSGVSVRIYYPNETIDLGDGCTLRVSEYYYLERSVHPTYTVSVSNNGEDFVYMTSSVYESEEFTETPENTEHIVFGVHGPNIHKAPDISDFALSTTKTLIFADAKDQKGDFDGEFISMDENGKYKITLEGE